MFNFVNKFGSNRSPKTKTAGRVFLWFILSVLLSLAIYDYVKIVFGDVIIPDYTVVGSTDWFRAVSAAFLKSIQIFGSTLISVLMSNRLVYGKFFDTCTLVSEGMEEVTTGDK